MGVGEPDCPAQQPHETKQVRDVEAPVGHQQMDTLQEVRKGGPAVA